MLKPECTSYMHVSVSIESELQTHAKTPKRRSSHRSLLLCQEVAERENSRAYAQFFIGVAKRLAQALGTACRDCTPMVHHEVQHSYPLVHVSMVTSYQSSAFAPATCLA